MGDPRWNTIEFDRWSRGDLSVETNEFGGSPIVLELKGDGYETYDLSNWMNPEEARELARKLVEAADAVEKVGAYSPPPAIDVGSTQEGS